MTIRQATLEDLPRLAPLAEQFYAASQVLKTFDIGRFVDLWTALLESGTGVVFLLCDGERIAGTIGGMAHREPYSEDMIAVEFYWFVSEESRGGGIRLYYKFEEWAKERGCDEIRMMHLIDSMPEKLDKVYRRLGFVPVEVLYAKRLKP